MSTGKSAWQDYTAAYGRLQFAPGETSKIVRVVITEDRLDGNDESFNVALSNPYDPQDTDFRGWKFWLDKLNQFSGDAVAAEMVKAFISSDEYRHRSGQ